MPRQTNSKYTVSFLRMFGIGVDIVRIDRFEKWLDFSEKKLMKVFHLQEIRELRKLSNNKNTSIQFLASRFASKEAAFKAFCCAGIKLGFLEMCKKIFIYNDDFGVPRVNIDEAFLKKYFGLAFKIDLSVSHEKEFSVSFVSIRTSV